MSPTFSSPRRGRLLTWAIAAIALASAAIAAADAARLDTSTHVAARVDQTPPPAARVDVAPTSGPLDALASATDWINSPPLAAADLRGKVVLVDFWTYSCINCLRTLPYVRAWSEKYRAAGLVVIGVHAPEFAFEHEPVNVRRAAAELHLDFPIAQDNDFAIWRAFRNPAWPAFWFVDAQGRVRGRHLGEGDYDATERELRSLLAEAGAASLPPGLVAPQGSGVEAAAGSARATSPETYLGWERADGFASGGLVPDVAHDYPGASALRADAWALGGTWTVERERIVLQRAGGRIAYRFRGRDLHLVLGPSTDGRPVRFRVRVDGQPPQADHGADTDAQGNGTVDARKLYQLVRQASGARERLFEIEFLDPGAQAYAFTFG
jgi:thiol-disulfide isomerase/thioredoxin